MTATDDTFTVGGPLPQIAAVSVHDATHVTITWAAGPRVDRVETIDLAPAVLRYKVYAPLRSNPDLFKTAHVSDDGFAIGWGREDGIDMASTMLEELAEQTMTPADFAAFVKRHGYTLDSVAAELGISRRQAAYYQNAKAVPRYIALACAYLDERDDGSRRLLAAQSDILREAVGRQRDFLVKRAVDDPSAIDLMAALRRRLEPLPFEQSRPR